MVDSASSIRSRSVHAKAVLGPVVYDRLADLKVLLVGAGGIGCELCTSICLFTRNDTADLT